jgi:hypothetical protein
MKSGIRISAQFNGKVWFPQEGKPFLWSSTPLVEPEFSEDKTSFYAENVALELLEDGDSYTIKSMADERCIVNLKVTKAAPGFVSGKDGKSYFGTDPANPWGSMRHAFWPRCAVEGTVMTDEGPIDFKGKGYFCQALQGMKPHHAAARWNFVNFQGPTYSAVMMEYTTPNSYGAMIVGTGGIAKDGEIVCAGTRCTADHVKSAQDGDNGWPEPTEVKYTWAGATKDGKAVEASIEAEVGKRLDRIDVMNEVPGFVKQIIATAVGTRPYIYQVCAASRRGPPSADKHAVLPREAHHAEAEDRRRGDHRGGSAVLRGHLHHRGRQPRPQTRVVVK